MKRGRPRQYDPSIPDHVDQLKLPPKAYWDQRDRVWYTHIDEGGRKRRKRLAGAAATLADLHRSIEELAHVDRGSIDWLHQQFMASPQWAALSEGTQRSYKASMKVLSRTPTRRGVSFDQLMVDRLRRQDMQQLVDTIGATRPTAANHVKRYLGRLFAWGMQRGKMRERANPAHELDAAVERRQFKMPTVATMNATIAFARARGALTGHSLGSCPPYLWMVMVLAYRCRLRGIEVLTLTDAHHHPDGVHTNRRKGSLDNITRWSPELDEVWEQAVAYRKAIWSRAGRVVPMRADQRRLLVNEEGRPIERSTLDSAWQRFVKLAIQEKVIRPEERFSLHGLKHRGITDSKDKKSGGHVDPGMVKRYDHEVPVVEQAGDGIVR